MQIFVRPFTAALGAAVLAILFLPAEAPTVGHRSGAALAADPVPVPEGARAEARAIVKQFATQLKGALKGAIDAGGFENAIGVCKSEAPEIAQALGSETGWQVARTALRVRNPDNTPQADERAVLEAFLARAEAGGDLKKMERDWVAESGGKASYRYMKAIPLGEICASCHGADIEPKLTAAIRSAYPQDRATGFKVGELRGAFTLTKPLE